MEDITNTKAATNRILAETTAIDIAEVDAVGGAKPEPEERPMHDVRQLEPNRQTLSTGEQVSTMQQGMVVVVQSNVQAEMESFGKQCANCYHFNHRLGQQQLTDMQEFGSPEDKKMIAELRAQVLDSGFVENIGEYTSVNDVFRDETMQFVREMGMCTALTSLKKEPVFIHPTQQCCPSKFADGTEIPFLYKPKDSDQEKRDKTAMDMLMFTASRKL